MLQWEISLRKVVYSQHQRVLTCHLEHFSPLSDWCSYCIFQNSEKWLKKKKSFDYIRCFVHHPLKVFIGVWPYDMSFSWVSSVGALWNDHNTWEKQQKTFWGSWRLHWYHCEVCDTFNFGVSVRVSEVLWNKIKMCGLLLSKTLMSINPDVLYPFECLEIITHKCYSMCNLV